MKLLKRLKRKKGFTLTECLISMLIFALMASIVMQILAIAIAQYRSNDSIDKDMDTQISDLVQENALVERETTNLVMKFVSGTGGTNNITINDMKIENGSSDGRPAPPPGPAPWPGPDTAASGWAASGRQGPETATDGKSPPDGPAACRRRRR